MGHVYLIAMLLPRLQALLSSNSSLPCLTSSDVLRHPFHKLVSQDMQHRGCCYGAVAAPHVCLALIMPQT